MEHDSSDNIVGRKYVAGRLLPGLTAMNVCGLSAGVHFIPHNICLLSTCVTHILCYFGLLPNSNAKF